MNCVHQQTEYRLRGNAIYAQCLNCGCSVGSAVSRSKFKPEQIEAMPTFDIELMDRRWKEDSAERTLFLKEQAEKERQERREEYAQYLLTDEWRDKRQRVLERDRHVCQACLQNRATQVHHTTYAHIFHEPLFELISVCVPCHENLHQPFEEPPESTTPKS